MSYIESPKCKFNWSCSISARAAVVSQSTAPEAIVTAAANCAPTNHPGEKVVRQSTCIPVPASQVPVPVSQVQVDRRASIATATSSHSPRSPAGYFSTVPHGKRARSASSHSAVRELFDSRRTGTVKFSDNIPLSNLRFDDSVL